MIAMTLRQHRYSIGALAVSVALITVVIALAAGTDEPVWWESATWYLLHTPLVLGGVFAVFWAAPLVSREYENRTHLFAWGQDVSPARWLAGKVVVLAGIAAGLSGILGAFAHAAMLNPSVQAAGFEPFAPQAFDASPQLMAAHALFGFGLGLLASVAIRLTLPAMGLTLFLFAGVRVLVMDYFRPYYLTPVRAFEDWSGPVGQQVPRPPGSMFVDGGIVDATGNLMEAPKECIGVSGAIECGRAHGVAGLVERYQPADRVAAFQWIESGIYLGSAAILFVIAFVWIRRRRQV
ncbi:hypothetical protein JOF56_000374 [Kibdelosporangium banguiense]|uniref:ABC transporter permease n=1 Tax=Kibdelosporangium banguiense TaxID=1365924 RepID=A0ABS4T7S8_9PSEU|nr:hypothetical protein [Kibdelosporangium banguiense]MBP2319989.1 hypothetical protein [Kibdelosporangium banguiense]